MVLFDPGVSEKRYAALLPIRGKGFGSVL